ncbi:MAG TPA: polysaccharide deacetylase family protein [Verrucomicrobiae bacterium]|jgi:peptidoglycan/xylan/chitin deacetylase (PgdA/CDA1 family)
MRNLAFALLRYSGLPFLLRQITQKNKVTIVVYHAPPAALARAHFAALQRRYHIIALADYLKARTEGTFDRLPSRPLIITLDDGHQSNFELAPVLDELKIPVTIFLCSGIVGTHRHFWWRHTQGSQEAEACKKMTDSERLRFLLYKGYRTDQEYADRQALSRDEIEQLKPRVDFQAHTVHHPILPNCEDAAAEREISDCKTVLEKDFQLQINALAYPNGDYSPRDMQCARQAGYRCALTLEPGFNTGSTELFELKRIPLQDDGSISELLVKTSGLWAMLSRRATGKVLPIASLPHAPSAAENAVPSLRASESPKF